VRIAVAGGGPAAVELAANLRRLVLAAGDAGHRAVITLIAERGLLPGFPRYAASIVHRVLGRSGVTVRTGERVRSVGSTGVRTDRSTDPFDLVLFATGVVPSRLFGDSGMATGPDGSMAVNDRLQALGHPEILGGGDCIWFTPGPLPRAGVFAVRQGPILAHNVERTLAGDSRHLRRFRPGAGFLLLLNLGDGSGLLWRRILGVPVAFRARWAWRLKDRIDRGFMRANGVAEGPAAGEGEHGG
jgi:NADH dehydrogenase FAD-containing subunit